MMNTEVEAIRQRYVRRNQLPQDKVTALYDPLNPSRYLSYAEKRRALIQCIEWAGLAPLRERRLIEIGCGNGDNLLQFLTLGFQPENLVGNELMAEYAANARRLLPIATQIFPGDAATLDLPEESFDIVFQSTVFSSILDADFQQKLADRMWSLVKPGGGILWYDFTFNNPNNPDVKGVTRSQIRTLFPQGQLKTWRITLAPPINRRVSKIHPGLYPVFNALPFLRTHLLGWIRKP